LLTWSWAERKRWACLGDLNRFHLALSSSGRLVGVLRPVVEAFVLSVFDVGHELALRGPVAGELVASVVAIQLGPLE
jgi:hypothetical protein